MCNCTSNQLCGECSRKTDSELLVDYWSAHAQFGPFDVGPEEFLRQCREKLQIMNAIGHLQWLSAEATRERATNSIARSHHLTWTLALQLSGDALLECALALEGARDTIQEMFLALHKDSQLTWEEYSAKAPEILKIDTALARLAASVEVKP